MKKPEPKYTVHLRKWGDNSGTLVGNAETKREAVKTARKYRGKGRLMICKSRPLHCEFLDWI